MAHNQDDSPHLTPPEASQKSDSSTPPAFEPRSRSKKKAASSMKPKPHISHFDGPWHVALRKLRKFAPLSPRAATSVFIVTAACGLLFIVSAQAKNDADNLGRDTNLISLVRASQDEVETLDFEVSALRDIVSQYANSSGQTQAEDTSITSLVAQPVIGPGVTITLTDAPQQAIPDGATPNDLVIHQQDIEDVMNALWNGGAEAMTVQGVRVTGQTVIRCIGNVILVDGQPFSPPYVVEAIGDPDALTEKVNANPRIVNYKAYVALYGLGWDLETNKSLHLPAASVKTFNSYAQVVD